MTVQKHLADPSRWTKKAYARDVLGNAVVEGKGIFQLEETVKSARAVCWCFVGSIAFCYPDSQQRKGVYRRCREALGCSPLQFNDDPGTTHAMVLDLARRLDI